MGKKARYILCILLVAAAVFLLIPKSRTVYGISDGGAYCLVTEAEDALAPWIWFDMSGNTTRFTASLDMRLSSVTNGTVEFHYGKVYAISDDDTQTWIFTVIDNDTLEFISRGSTIPVDSEGKAILSDGARFKRIEE